MNQISFNYYIQQDKRWSPQFILFGVNKPLRGVNKFVTDNRQVKRQKQDKGKVQQGRQMTASHCSYVFYWCPCHRWHCSMRLYLQPNHLVQII